MPPLAASVRVTLVPAQTVEPGEAVGVVALGEAQRMVEVMPTLSIEIFGRDPVAPVGGTPPL